MPQMLVHTVVALPTVLNTTSSLKSPSLEDCRYLIS